MVQQTLIGTPESETVMSGILEGIRVLDLSRFQAGPRAGMILADLGAEVIKIERIGGEVNRSHAPMIRGQSLYFSTYNRGKKSVCLNLRDVEGRSVFWDLLKTADFLIQNFRPGVMAIMGMDYPSLCAVKPDIIMLSASAFGQYGPYSSRPGFDTVGQAMSGLMSLTGAPFGEPVGTASSIMDRMTALHLTIGALAALRHRDSTGEGQEIDVSLMDVALSTVEIPLSSHLMGGGGGGVDKGGRPAIRAKDGWVIIVAGTAEMRESLEKATGVAVEALPDGTFPPLGPAASESIKAWCAARSMEEIVSTLLEHDVVAAPVNSVAQAALDPHLHEREMLVKIPDPYAGEIYAPGMTIKFSKTPGEIGTVATPGQHTDEILHALGYDADRISHLRSIRVVS